ncbi:hypothetical protein GCM10009738_65340 [Kitasatospora viridis]
MSIESGAIALSEPSTRMSSRPTRAVPVAAGGLGDVAVAGAVGEVSGIAPTYVPPFGNTVGSEAVGPPDGRATDGRGEREVASGGADDG